MTQRYLKNFATYNSVSQGFNATPDFTVTGPASVNEGSAATFNVRAYGLKAGTTLDWATYYVNNIGSSRFDNQTGTVTMLNNYVGAFDVTVDADNHTAVSAQDYSVALYWNNPINPFVISSPVVVNDTSQTPPFGDQVVINLNDTTLLVAYTNIASPGNFQQDGNGNWIIAVNGNYAPYLPIVQNINTSWTVSGGPNNLVNEPVLGIVPNYYGSPLIVGVVVAANPGDNSVNFIFTPPAPTTWNDASPNHWSATLVNGALASTSYGNIVTLDGTNDYISLPQNYVDWLNNDITISIWFKTTDRGVILGQQGESSPNASSGYVPAIYIGTNDGLYVTTFWHNNSALTGIDVRVNDGQWHMLTVTTKLDGTTHVYIDDSDIMHTILYQAQTSYTTDYFYFLGTGARTNWTSAGGSTYMNMSIGSFKTWYGEAPQAWIQNEYTNTKARFLSGPQTMIAKSAYDGTSTGNVSINWANYPAASRIPVGATVTSDAFSGSATVTESNAGGNMWHIGYTGQTARPLLTTDTFTFTWTV